jgi:hypothetical protein
MFEWCVVRCDIHVDTIHTCIWRDWIVCYVYVSAHCKFYCHNKKFDMVFVHALKKRRERLWTIWNWPSSHTNCMICNLWEVGAMLKVTIQHMLTFEWVYIKVWFWVSHGPNHPLNIHYFWFWDSVQVWRWVSQTRRTTFFISQSTKIWWENNVKLVPLHCLIHWSWT